MKPKRTIKAFGREMLPKTKDYLSALSEDQRQVVTKAVAIKAEEQDDGERSVVVIMTTDALDSDGEVILSEGIDLSHYLDNPIVLYMHDWTQPCGKMLWVKPTANGLKGKISFPKADPAYKGEWLPDKVWQLVKTGIVKGVSISICNLERTPPTQEEVAARPELVDCVGVIRKGLLMELSVVTIPANPECLGTDEKSMAKPVKVPAPKKRASQADIARAIVAKMLSGKPR